MWHQKNLMKETCKLHLFPKEPDWLWIAGKAQPWLFFPSTQKFSWHHLSVLTYQTYLLHSEKMSLGNFLLIKQSYENKLALFMNISPVWNNMCKIKIKFGKPQQWIIQKHFKNKRHILCECKLPKMVEQCLQKTID